MQPVERKLASCTEPVSVLKKDHSEGDTYIPTTNEKKNGVSKDAQCSETDFVS